MVYVSHTRESASGDPPGSHSPPPMDESGLPATLTTDAEAADGPRSMVAEKPDAEASDRPSSAVAYKQAGPVSAEDEAPTLAALYSAERTDAASTLGVAFALLGLAV